MKHSITLLALATLLAACGGSETTDLGLKRAKLEQLKGQYTLYADSIKEV